MGALKDDVVSELQAELAEVNQKLDKALSVLSRASVLS